LNSKTSVEIIKINQNGYKKYWRVAGFSRLAEIFLKINLDHPSFLTFKIIVLSFLTTSQL